MLEIDNICYQVSQGQHMGNAEIKRLIGQLVLAIPATVKNILLIPPDHTRKHSGLGELTAFLYRELRKTNRSVAVMPAVGTHSLMTGQQTKEMFGPEIPSSAFITHRWREDAVSIGVIPVDFVSEVSEGEIAESIDVRVNRNIVNGRYDLMISLGQVLPHEVVGMANYGKNIFVGCGGEEMINKSHYIGAVYGLERLIGRDHSPVRKLYDYAEKNFLNNIPLIYFLTVNGTLVSGAEHTALAGLFIGRERTVFEAAVKLSQATNIVKLDRKVKKIIAYLDEREFTSTWMGCKAIYRTRLAIEDGGELIVVAPGLETLGEDPQLDRLLRKYGYVGKTRIMEYVRDNPELQENLAAPAHLIHGSTEGRFSVTFVSDRISKEELESVNFKHLSLEKFKAMYNDRELCHGYNHLADGEEIFLIHNPATGLWVYGEDFEL